MRHVIGLVLTGVGAFILVMGVLVHFYMAPRLIQAPVDAYQVTRLEAVNAKYFDIGALKVREGVTLTATNTVRGDVKSSRKGTAVWDSFTVVEDLTTGVKVDLSTRRVAFDRQTALLTHCCGAAVEGDKNVRQTGIGMSWPIPVEKKTYQVFDPSTKRTWPAVFSGQETVSGIKTYRFVTRIPSTKLEGESRELPGTLLGLDEKLGSVAADRYYQSETTVLIDPRTGVPLDQRQKVLSTLQAQPTPEVQKAQQADPAAGRLVVADMDLRMKDESKRSLLAKTKDGAGQIQLLTTVGPVILLLAGLVPIVIGVPLSIAGRRSPQHRRSATETDAAAESATAKA